MVAPGQLDLPGFRRTLLRRPWPERLNEGGGFINAKSTLILFAYEETEPNRFSHGRTIRHMFSNPRVLLHEGCKHANCEVAFSARTASHLALNPRHPPLLINYASVDPNQSETAWGQGSRKNGSRVRPDQECASRDVDNREMRNCRCFWCFWGHPELWPEVRSSGGKTSVVQR